MQVIDRFDVVIVGARCGGAALAHRLARAGLRVLAVDRATFPSDTVSTHALGPHGSELLKRWGLFDAVAATGAPVARTLHLTIGELDASVPVADDRPGYFAPRRTALDTVLVRAARDAGAEVWEASTLLSLESSSGGRVTGVRLRRRDGDEVTVNAPIVVGADGVHSSIARTVGASEYRVRPSHEGGVYAYYAGTRLTEFAVGLGERRLMLAVPTNDDQVCIAAAVHADDFEALHGAGDRGVLDVARQTSSTIAGALTQGIRASRFVVFKPVAGRYRQPWGDGWALVGDAGHYLDPFTGQGMANAFLGAELLGTALVDGLGGGRPLSDAFDEYHQARDEMTFALHDVTHDLAEFGWDTVAGLNLFLGFRAAVEEIHDQVRARFATVGVQDGL